MSEKIFVTAIGTDSGKSVVSAILTEKLKADYWKPIQAGFPTDTNFVKSLVSNSKTIFHSESYLLKHPMSPHAAAALENTSVNLAKINLPKTDNHLIIEGAGGLLVPINETEFIADLISNLDTEIVLVANLYLGSINHTLLTINELQRRKISIKGIVFNGDSNLASEEVILKQAQVPCLLRLPKLASVDKEAIKKYALLMKDE